MALKRLFCILKCLKSPTLNSQFFRNFHSMLILLCRYFYLSFWVIIFILNYLEIINRFFTMCGRMFFELFLPEHESTFSIFLKHIINWIINWILMLNNVFSSPQLLGSYGFLFNCFILFNNFVFSLSFYLSI